MDSCGGCDLSAHGGSGWIDFYATPNTKVTGTLSWTRASDIFSFGDSGDVDIIGGTGRITHRFAGTPINIFGEAGYWEFSNPGPEGDGQIVSVLAGITIMLDGAGYTQQEFDRQVPFGFRHPLLALGNFDLLDD